MREGTDYLTYINNIRRKTEAWNIVTDCFAFGSREMPEDVRLYFDSLEDIADAAYPNGYDFPMVSENECIINLKNTINWYENLYDNKCYSLEVEKRKEYDKKIVKNLKRALKHKFGVNIDT